jgi:hypothetical protein
MESVSMTQATAAQPGELFPKPIAHPQGRVRINPRLILLAAAIVTMGAYFLPFLLLGDNSYITIHDNLDGEFVEKYLLVATGKALTFDGSAPIENIMNGLPRAQFPSGLNVSILLFYIVPPVWAYIVNFILVHVVAFCGMFLLLRNHFLKDDDDYLVAGAMSLCFFLVPFYTTHGLTVGGQPLLAYAFLNIREGKRDWWNYLIVGLFPFWSNMALIAPFAVTALLLILVIDWIRSHTLNKRLLTAIFLFVSVYVALQYQLINSILGSTASISHRTAWNRWTDFTLSSNLGKVREILFTTQYHTGSFSTLPIIIAAGAVLILLIVRRRRADTAVALIVGIALICLEYGFYDWLMRWFGRLVPGLQTFNGSRFYFLLPTLWLVLLALCLKEFSSLKWGKLIVWCLIIVQFFAIFKFNTEYRNSARLLFGKSVYEPSFKRFFARDLFTEVDQFIGRPKSSYRVVSIGMHPSVTEFNGFYSLDGYLSSYPLSYKLQFRRIIAKELDKNDELRDYFDSWGNRCYVFSSELGLNDLCSGDTHYVLHDLQLDTTQLRAMGCEYVISAVEIDNSAENGLILERQFSSPNSFWHVYLYRVLAAPSSYSIPGSASREGLGRAHSKRSYERGPSAGETENEILASASFRPEAIQRICHMCAFRSMP